MVLLQSLVSCPRWVAVRMARILSRHNRSFFQSPPHRKVFDVTDSDTFMERVMNSDIPVLVNFHAEWCEPCQILTPLLRKLLATSTDVDLAVIDVEDCPELVHTFEVKAVPAVVAVTNGQVADKFVGLVDAAMVEGLINKLSVGNKKTTKGADTSHLENKHHSPQ
ncbi:thioredoxin-like [Hetaerina americana]|uniref:thioredoxin-like n=1 Tax=Hetaerina americana TaxID=62018 RepID=UPI003A7F2E3A